MVIVKREPTPDDIKDIRDGFKDHIQDYGQGEIKGNHAICIFKCDNVLFNR